MGTGQTMNGNERCATCVFFDANTLEPERGYCRRFAPTVIINSKDEHTTTWPYVNITEWCGEYEKRS